MEKYERYSFSFGENCRAEEFSAVLGALSPCHINKLDVTITEADFNYGDFRFILKTGIKNETKIHFYNSKRAMNDFWRFLETLVDTKEPLIFELFSFGEETILYAEPKNSVDIRFVVLNLNSEETCTALIDVIISKRRFIKQFYTALFGLFEKYKSIAYFETPSFDYDFWIKDSAKIKEFLKIR